MSYCISYLLNTFKLNNEIQITNYGIHRLTMEYRKIIEVARIATISARNAPLFNSYMALIKAMYTE